MENLFNYTFHSLSSWKFEKSQKIVAPIFRKLCKRKHEFLLHINKIFNLVFFIWPVYQHNDSVLCVTNWLARRSRLRNHCGFVSVIVSAKNLHEILPFFLSLLLYYSSCWENHDKWYYQLISWFWTFFVILASNHNFWSDLISTF